MKLQKWVVLVLMCFMFIVPLGCGGSSGGGGGDDDGRNTSDNGTSSDGSSIPL